MNLSIKTNNISSTWACPGCRCTWITIQSSYKVSYCPSCGFDMNDIKKACEKLAGEYEPEGKPDYLTEEHINFLDNVRASRKVTNMYKSVPLLINEFSDLSLNQARKIVSYWCDTYLEENSI